MAVRIFLLRVIYARGIRRMVLTRFVLLAAFLLAASSVSAANIIDLGPSDYRNWGTGSNSHTGSGIRSTTGQTVRLPPLNGNLNVNRNAVIPYGSIANGLRQFTRINPASVAASAAVTGLFLAVDWAWDELTQEWVKHEFECPVGSICAIDGEFIVQNMCRREPYAMTSVGEVRTITAAEPFWLGTVSYPAGTTVTVQVIPGPSNDNPGFITHCVQRYPTGEWPPSGGSFPILIGTVVTEPGVPELTPVPVDFSELEAYLPSANPNEVGQAGNDAMQRQGSPLPGFQDQTITGPSSVAGPETTSTSTDPVTGDNIVTNTSTTTNISYGDTTITTTNTTTANTYTNGSHTSTTTTTETSGELPVTQPDGGGAGDWPGFCDWATTVCDFIAWMREPFTPPEVEWPIIEDQDFEEEFEFSLVAECPEPYTINLVLFGPVTFSWEPFCTLAGFIKPLVLISAYIFAAFISLGIARGRT